MGRLEWYRPRLKAGHKYVRGNQTLFVPDDGSESVVLPADQNFLLGLLDGEKSLTDIIHEIWEKEGAVQFRSLFVTLRKLKAADALENGEEFPDSQQIQTAVYNRPVHFFYKPFWKKQILGPKDSFRSFSWMFYSLSFALIALVASGFLTKPLNFATNDFLKVDGSYALGLVTFFVAASFLMTTKALVKALLISYRMASTPPLSFQAQALGVYLKADDEAIFQLMKKGDAALYWVSSNVAMFGVSLVWNHLFPGSISAHLMPLSLLLTLVDLDPYMKSEATKFFKRFFSSYNLSELIPYFRKRALLAVLDKKTQIKNEMFLTLYATYGVAWTFGAYYFSSALFSRTFPNLLSEISNSPAATEKTAAAVILVGLGCMNVFFLLDSLQLIAENILSPFTTPFLKVLRTFKTRMAEKVPTNVIRQKMEGLPLFLDLFPSAVEYLAAHSQLKNFGKGSPIIIQGTHGDEMYVLLSGKVDVRHRQPSGATPTVVSMSAPTVFGEMAVLGAGVRTAHVVATEPCQCLVVTKSALNGLKETFDPSQYNKIVGRIQLQQFMAASSLFRDMPHEIIQKFTALGTFQEAPAGQVLLKQGEKGDTFFLLVRGMVDVSVNGVKVTRIEQGGFFGEISLLAHVRRTATVRAMTDCRLYRIRAEEFWNLLASNLSFAMYIESVAELRLKEGQEVERLTG